jgi:hypothetical protein
VTQKGTISVGRIKLRNIESPFAIDWFCIGIFDRNCRYNISSVVAPFNVFKK